jgi:hypothetical protein
MKKHIWHVYAILSVVSVLLQRQAQATPSTLLGMGLTSQSTLSSANIGDISNVLESTRGITTSLSSLVGWQQTPGALITPVTSPAQYWPFDSLGGPITSINTPSAPWTNSQQTTGTPNASWSGGEGVIFTVSSPIKIRPGIFRPSMTAPSSTMTIRLYKNVDPNVPQIDPSTPLGNAIVLEKTWTMTSSSNIVGLNSNTYLNEEYTLGTGSYALVVNGWDANTSYSSSGTITVPTSSAVTVLKNCFLLNSGAFGTGNSIYINPQMLKTSAVFSYTNVTAPTFSPNLAINSDFGSQSTWIVDGIGSQKAAYKNQGTGTTIQSVELDHGGEYMEQIITGNFTAGSTYRLFAQVRKETSGGTSNYNDSGYNGNAVRMNIQFLDANNNILQGLWADWDGNNYSKNGKPVKISSAWSDTSVELTANVTAPKCRIRIAGSHGMTTNWGVDVDNIYFSKAN